MIAIIGTLIGLLLPAVQAARESARQTQCGNNMKQWSLGMQTYHDTDGALPLGATDWPCTKHTWLPSMWAFIEQIDLANRYDWGYRIMLWPNVNNTTTKPLPVSVARLSIYYCPSASFCARGYKGKEATRFRNITDGLSKTLILSEINLITTDDENPADSRGSMWSGLWFDTGVSAIQAKPVG